MTNVVSLPVGSTDRKLVQQAADALTAGEQVVLPTETVYGIAVRADRPDAIQQMLQAKKRPASSPFTLAFADRDAVRSFGVSLHRISNRLLERAFPGPLTLVLPLEESSSAWTLPETVRPFLFPLRQVGVRVPQHDFTQAVLRTVDFPVALTSANLSGECDTTSGTAVQKVLDGQVAWIFDDGDTALKQASTVVRFLENSETYTILRAGAISETVLRRLTEPLILFVCTGNTCRSPMAEVLAREILAQERGLSVEELETIGGVHLLSAGVSASNVSPATKEAQQAVSAEGLDLSIHVSQPLSLRILHYADWIYTMTPEHAAIIGQEAPWTVAKMRVLAENSGGIADPYGGSPQVYESCLRQIRKALRDAFQCPDFRAIFS